MSEFESVLDYQVRSMLEGIEADLARRREAIRAEAAGEARALLKRTRREALARTRAAIEEERGLYEDRIQQARAAVATKRRQRRQQRERVALESSRALLRQALERRWLGVETRRDWIEAGVAEAAAVLEHGEWTVRHPGDLAGDELERLESLVRGFADKHELLADDEMRCGLAVESRGAVVDMSIEGLLGRREDIDGRLLAALYADEMAGDEQAGEGGTGATGAAGGRSDGRPAARRGGGRSGDGQDGDTRRSVAVRSGATEDRSEAGDGPPPAATTRQGAGRRRPASVGMENPNG